MRGASSSPSAPSGVQTRGQKRRIGQSDVWDLIVNNTTLIIIIIIYIVVAAFYPRIQSGTTSAFPPPSSSFSFASHASFG